MTMTREGAMGWLNNLLDESSDNTPVLLTYEHRKAVEFAYRILDAWQRGEFRWVSK